MLLRREVPVGAVVPDLVAIHGDRIAGVRVDRWSWRHAHLVHRLRRRGGLRVPTLSRLLFESDERVRETLDDLQKAGIVSINVRGVASLSSAYQGQQRTITAFEAKLTRWREALAQALAYRSFADRVVVVLPDGDVDDDAIHCFRAQGVGLWMVGAELQVELLKPRLSVCKRAEKEWVLGSASSAAGQRRWVVR